MLFGAEAAAQVIQVEWQALAVFGSTVGGALVAAAKIVSSQLAKNADGVAKRHEENRADSQEGRKDDRDLSVAILSIQSQTVKTLADMQAEIRRVLERLGECEAEGGSKPHPALPPHPKKTNR